MSHRPVDLEQSCTRALDRHLEVGDEQTLHEAYEFGRASLDQGAGVLDMALSVVRASRQPRPAAIERGEAFDDRVEGFVLECLSPFEMAYRGAREASSALRQLDERREEQVRQIAHELHDQSGQLLAMVHRALGRLRPHLAPGGGRHYEQAIAMLHQVQDEIRRLAHELRPAILDDLGLIPALRFLGQGMAQRSGLAVRVQGSTEGRLPPAIETALYRAAQEALNNVARHARASSATIEVRRNERELVWRIRDDGWGFDLEAVLAGGGRQGIGLNGIRQRVAPLGGELEIFSRPGGGTELVIRIPLEMDHAQSSPDRG